MMQQFLMNILIVLSHCVEGSSSCLLVMLGHIMGCPKTLFSGWMKTVMQQAGVDTTVFKQHSIRVASTSKARSCNVSLPAVMKAASLSSVCLFNIFLQQTTLAPKFT